MKSNFEKYRHVLANLCERALQGDLSIDAFHATWPNDISKTEFVSELFDDLEQGVEHFPAKLFSKKKDIELWLTLYESYKLRLDIQLLKSQLKEEHIFSLRKIILEEDIRDDKLIKKLIKKLIEESCAG